MPKRTDIKKILIIGSGPIVIGQASEFDYSGTQACRSLKDEGYEVVLVNSNPATIMTDPEMADRTYIEPLTIESVAAIIEKERPDALLPTVGGQTALNLSIELYEQGVLERFSVQLIGANPTAIKVGEDRELFKAAMEEIGIPVPRGGFAHNWEEAEKIVETTDYPAIVRPSFTLGGTGGGVAFNPEEFEEIVRSGLAASPISQVLIEESILGWKEYELEVMRDLADNVVIICSIENFDPMGVHTGDSITVAPAQTLTDVEYQRLRDMSIACIRKVGVETGGSNIQFAVNPENGDVRIIEMNPRVSRSSALASKATGFPIAKIAAKLAVGYTLDEIPNDITKKTPASFEPTIDYVVAKIPKWAFEKFPQAEDSLGTQMKSVGEVMAIGRTFKEALFKGLRSLEATKPLRLKGVPDHVLQRKLARPNSQRFSYITYALQHGYSIEEVFRLTKVDRWFLAQLQDVMRVQDRIEDRKLEDIPAEVLRTAKEYGLSDRRISFLTGSDELAVRERRKSLGIVPVYKRVDTCGAEFESFTPYLYSTYEEEDESNPVDRPKIMILGSGPNRIGQGIEFDYCCCHASFALRKADFETIMVNCNPETVSTDYDTSDRLYFEPLTFEDVMNIVENEKPTGVIVQFGGQTPLNLANRLHEAGVPIIGTSPDSIDLAEDRKRFGALLDELKIPAPPNGTAVSQEEARAIAVEIGYPVLVRPSYVLGGRAMAIVYDEQSLDEYMRTAVDASPERPILIDKFLERAAEFDVDALADETAVVIAGIQEHIEEAGIHSGDSSSILPPQKIGEEHLETIRHYTRILARALNVVGLMNIQFAIKDDRVYVLEVNPRASRTVPFVSKATNVPLAAIASLIMAGAKTLADFNLPDVLPVNLCFVKSPVFPFAKFPGVDPVLGPEMHSTGEVMGVGATFGEAYGKAMSGAGVQLPSSGTAFLSVNDSDKGQAVVLARRLKKLGFDLIATYGTTQRLKEVGLEAESVFKVNEGRPNIVDYIKRGDIALIINTPLGRISHFDEQAIRQAALRFNVPCVTTITGAEALIEAITAKQQDEKIVVRSLQEIHQPEKSFVVEEARSFFMKNKFSFAFLFALLVLAYQSQSFAQRELGVRPTNSGGVLMPEQAAYDVQSYDLKLQPNIEEQSIKGVLTVTAKIVNPINKFVLDLDAPLTVESVARVFPLKDKADAPLKFERREGKIWIALTAKAGETINVRVVYGGKPRVAPRPPWVGGFVWAKTADGSPWFATAVQNDGADLWFPVKDHPSDKPETTSLHFTVPNNLVAASNGKLQSVVKNADGTQTFNWFVSQPISNYNIALNVAPYKLVEDKMQSVAGDTIPISFYVLPEHADKAQGLIDKTKDYVRFFEEYLGPYPFRADKLGIAETPHLGMEHQSITAYGNNFKYDENGFDWLMFHELGHEWWANLVTAKDWNDFWIHEGFQSFMDALFAEKKLGREQFVKSLPARIKGTKNVKPVAPREPRTTVEMYLLPPDYIRSDGDIYGKGALILNSLRSLIGDEAFFKSLRRMAYPAPAMEKVTNGKQIRLVTTDEFIRIAEGQSGKKLDWFFEVYVRQPALPRLVAETKPNSLVLRWETPNNLPFPMPVEVKIGNETKRIEMTNGTATISLSQGAQFTIDPNGWLLKAL